VVEGLLAGHREFESETLLAPDLVVPEVANALFVHHRILHAIPDGLPYLARLFRAIESGSLVLVPVTEDLASASYEIAANNDSAIYGCVFIALALRSGLQLRTRDRRQAEVLENERKRLPSRGHRDSGERSPHD
jgi:predicted nucleic acid-binding protein